jgi:hypothetical protein
VLVVAAIPVAALLAAVLVASALAGQNPGPSPLLAALPPASAPAVSPTRFPAAHADAGGVSNIGPVMIADRSAANSLGTRARPVGGFAAILAR